MAVASIKITGNREDRTAQTYLKRLLAGDGSPAPECGTYWTTVVHSMRHLVVEGGNTFDFAKGLLRQFPIDELLTYEFPSENGHIAQSPSPEDKNEDAIMAPLPDEVKLSPELSRGACPLREEFIRYSEMVSPEGYSLFHEAAWWMLLSIIDARRTYADFSDEVYTNLYIVFAAPTTEYAKSQTANAVRKVLYAAGLDWLLCSDRQTPQKFLSDAAGKYIPSDYADMEEEDKYRLELKMAMSGQRGWNNDEFGKFVKGMLRQNSVMSDWADIFLTFDNCPPSYSNATILRGGEPIKDPYLSMLGCMTMANVRDIAKAGAEFWNDGFWARFLFISPPPGTGIDSPFGLGKKHVPGELSTGLRAWHERLGVPKIKIEEKKDDKGKPTGKYEKIVIEKRRETGLVISGGELGPVYRAWASYRSALKKMVRDLPNDDLAGSYMRLPTLAMRIATLAASLAGSPTIELSHWALAQEFIEKCRLGLHHFYSQVNMPKEVETMEEKIIKLLEKKGHRLTARQIGQGIWGLTTSKAEEYLSALGRSGDVVSVREGKTAYYDLPLQGVSVEM